jgi:hypothetical protein
MKTCPPVETIIGVMQQKSYRVFSNKKGYDLNIVGIRSAEIDQEVFNDWLNVFYMQGGRWNGFSFPCTTDPGSFYLNHPLNVTGTAILKPGQYRGSHKVGRHKNYKALQQNKPVTVYRDDNRNGYLDTEGMSQQKGMFGINIHRSTAHRPSTVIGKWSAGCQVLQDPLHFSFLLSLCEQAAERYGNSFSYTLLEEKDFNPA